MTIGGTLGVTGAITGNVTGNLTGDVTGNVSGTALTVTQAAQTAITSVGTLTGLTVAGTISNSSFTIPNSIGSAGQALKVAASGTTLEWGTVSAAELVTGAAQTNITSLGSLTGLDVNGAVTISDNLSLDGDNKELRFYEGSNYVGFEAPALSANQIWVLPTADGTSDQVLKTDGSGTLSWSAPSVGIGTSAPASPTDGQLWWDSSSLNAFIYYDDGDSSQWVEFMAKSVISSVTVGTSAPSSPSDGQLWWDSSELIPYVYYNDGSSTQWVEFIAGGGRNILTIAADSGTSDLVVLGADTLTFEGTTNEIETTVSNNKINLGLPTNVTVGGTITAAAFNTSSDYRLKENVVTAWDATTRLKQLKPSRFNFIANTDVTMDGFLAHEVSSIVPEAIFGEKDAIDSDGNPEYQQIDQSKLVPLLVKTIQELEARIAALESA